MHTVLGHGVKVGLIGEATLRHESAIAGRMTDQLICSGKIDGRSEEHTSELQSLMRISYAVFCLKKKKKQTNKITSDKKIKNLNTKITITQTIYKEIKPHTTRTLSTNNMPAIDLND